MLRGLGLLRRSPPATETVAFVLCIERNVIRDQALLLIESIRAFAGAHRNAPIWAVASRPGLGVDRPTRAKLEALDVNYFEGPLNVACPEYGGANRVYAAAWVAGHTSATTLIVLDSDTLMLGEPELLGPSADVAVRPVDFKGITTTVFEDRRNPTIAAAEETLRLRGVEVLLQSGPLADDLRVLLSAGRLVASIGTLALAVGMLAPRIDTFYQFTGPPNPVLKLKGLRIVRAQDVKGEFAVAVQASWGARPEQLAMMLSYPIDALQFEADGTA